MDGWMDGWDRWDGMGEVITDAKEEDQINFGPIRFLLCSPLSPRIHFKPRQGDFFVTIIEA
jgi:hypothetical protein